MSSKWLASGACKRVSQAGWPDELGLGTRIIDSRGELTKLATTIFGQTYEEMRPPKGHTGIHLTAYGDFEKWGGNRNGDSFPAAASAKYHHTFVKYGHPYRNHNNKDPAKAIGQIHKSAHNTRVSRVELFVSLDNNKAAAELQRLAKDGELAWSMGCKVPGDRCDVCQTFRKNAADPRQCAHVRDHLGDILKTGQAVVVHNDDPLFYDISTVPRGADRTAFDLKVAAPAQVAAVCDDDPYTHYLCGTTPREIERMKTASAIRAVQQRMRVPTLCSAGQRVIDNALLKTARQRFTDGDLALLRAYEPSELWGKLASAGVVLSAPAFFACAFHDDPDFTDNAAATMAVVRGGVFAELHGNAEEKAAITNAYFDLDSHVRHGYSSGAGSSACTALSSKLAQCSFARGYDALLGAHEDWTARPAGSPGRTDAALKLAGAYAAYKLSAVRAITTFHPSADRQLLLELAAAQDLAN